LIAISYRLWSQLGFSDSVRLEINSLGELTERNQYKKILVEYLNEHFDELDAESQKRLDKNPLRILDSKNPEMQQLINNAPKLMDCLDENSRHHFETFCDGLDALSIPYTVNPKLVRGLDYYGHTVFEWVTDQLGSQATICAGGRYDKLVEQLGGSATPAVGFALGMERILLLMETLGLLPLTQQNNSVFIISTTDTGMKVSMALAESIRSTHPTLDVFVNTAGGSFKSQFKRADKSGARLALILGEDEVSSKKVSIKDLRSDIEQRAVEQSEINQILVDYLA